MILKIALKKNEYGQRKRKMNINSKIILMKLLKECEHCGSDFTCDRNSAKFCSDSCKSLANRQRRKLEAAAGAQQLQKAKFDKVLDDMVVKQDGLLKQLHVNIAEQKPLNEGEKVRNDENQQTNDAASRIFKKDKQKREKANEVEKTNTKIKLLGIGAMLVIGIVDYYVNESGKSGKSGLEPHSPIAKPDETTKPIDSPDQIKQATTVDKSSNNSNEHHEDPGALVSEYAGSV